jgi:HAMP domain-containing protein
MVKEQKRRRLKNILISPESQIRYGAIYLAVTIVANLAVTAFGLNLYYYWVNDSGGGTSLLAMIIGGCVVVTLAMYAFAFFLGLMVTHKIFGPIVPIQRTLNQLKAGEYSARVTLRKADEIQMKMLAESINELAAQLERKLNGK